jgi:hypothetical protein
MGRTYIELVAAEGSFKLLNSTSVVAAVKISERRFFEANDGVPIEDDADDGNNLARRFISRPPSSPELLVRVGNRLTCLEETCACGTAGKAEFKLFTIRSTLSTSRSSRNSPLLCAESQCEGFDCSEHMMTIDGKSMEFCFDGEIDKVKHRNTWLAFQG